MLVTALSMRIKRLNLLDIKLLQFTAIFLGLVIVKLIPQILEIHILWFAGLAILCGLKPMLVVLKTQ